MKLVRGTVYQFKKAYHFMGEAAEDSKQLVHIFARNWNLAVEWFKSGEFHDDPGRKVGSLAFWEEYTEVLPAEAGELAAACENIRKRMWELEDNVNEEVLFSKVLYLLAPSEYIYIPVDSQRSDTSCIPVSKSEAITFFSKMEKEFERIPLSWLEKIFLQNFKPAWNEKYDADFENVLVVLQMFREHVFCWYGFKKVEELFENAWKTSIEQKRVSEACRKDLMLTAWRVTSAYEWFGRYKYFARVHEKAEDFAQAYFGNKDLQKLEPMKVIELFKDFVAETVGKERFVEWLEQINREDLIDGLKKRSHWCEKEIKMPEKELMLSIGELLCWSTQEECEKRRQEIPCTDSAWSKYVNSIRYYLTQGKEMFLVLKKFMPNQGLDWETSCMKSELKAIERTAARKACLESNNSSITRDLKLYPLHQAVIGQGIWRKEFTFAPVQPSLDKEITIKNSVVMASLLACAPIKEQYREGCQMFLRELKKEQKLCAALQQKENLKELIAGFRHIIHNILSETTDSEERLAAADFYCGILAEVIDLLTHGETMQSLGFKPMCEQVMEFLRNAEMVRKPTEFPFEYSEELKRKTDEALFDSRRSVNLPKVGKKYEEFKKSKEHEAWREGTKSLKAVAEEYEKISNKTIAEERRQRMALLQVRADVKMQKGYVSELIAIENRLYEQTSDLCSCRENAFENWKTEYNQVEKLKETKLAAWEEIVKVLKEKEKKKECRKRNREYDKKQRAQKRKKRYAKVRKVYDKVYDKVAYACGEVTYACGKAAKICGKVAKTCGKVFKIAGLTVVAVLCICLLAQGARFAVKQVYYGIPLWNTQNGVLTANYEYNTGMKKYKDFAKRLLVKLDENGALTLPYEADRVGNLALKELSSVEENPVTVTKLVIPEGVTELTADFSIEGMTELKEMKLPNSLRKIQGMYTGSGIQSIVAENVTELIGQIQYGSVFNGTDIPGGAFSGCTELKRVYLPKVTELQKHSFDGCTSLTDVNVDSVAFIDEYVFKNCSALKNLTLAGAEEVASYAFTGCTSLETVNLPNVKKICMSSFQNCGKLKEVHLPKAEIVNINLSLDIEKLYIGSSIQELNVQLVVPQLTGAEGNTYMKHKLGIVLESGATYSQQVLDVLDYITADPATFGEITVSYE